MKAVREAHYDLARRILKTAQDNGWDTITLKRTSEISGLIHTEIVEAEIEAHEGDIDALRFEIADCAIRILHFLEALWPGRWALRIPMKGVNRFQPIEVLMAPVRIHLRAAVEAWRMDNQNDVQCAFELALGECMRLSRSLGFNLYHYMTKKNEINSKRGKLHGKKNSAG